MPLPALLPPGTPDEVVERAKRAPRVPVFDPRVGRGPVAAPGAREQRIVVLGDSLSHGFQSGAIYQHRAVVPGADRPGAGLVRRSSATRSTTGPAAGCRSTSSSCCATSSGATARTVDAWELRGALLRVRAVMDAVEDYWERGAGQRGARRRPRSTTRWRCTAGTCATPSTRTAASLAAAIKPPRDDLIDQLVANHSAARGAARLSALVAATRAMTLARRRARRWARTVASRPWWCSSAPTTRSGPSPT